MSARIGLAVDDTCVRAALVRGHTVRWRHEVPLDGGDLRSAVQRILHAAPRQRFARRRAAVLLGPAYSQLRRLEGLPPLPNRKLVTQLVRENTNAFFLHTAPSFAIPEIHVTGVGTRWGVALDRSAVDDAVAGAAAAGYAVVAIATSRTAPWQQTIDDAALAAASLTTHSPFAWRASGGEARSRFVRRAQIAAGTLVVAAAATAAVIAPTVRVVTYERGAQAEIARLRSVELQATHTISHLRSVSQFLDAAASFELERGHVTRLLGDLSEALPESTAIVTMRVDSVEGSFVAIAPHVMDVLPELAGIHEMLGARIAGSVTRETFAGARVERATFRFRRPARGGTVNKAKR